MKRIVLECKKLYDQFDRILVLFSVIFATMEVVWIPINSWLSEVLLGLTGYAYLSPTNLLAVLSQKWWVTALFLLLVLVNLVLVYLEIGLLIVGSIRILQTEEKLRPYLKYLVGQLQRIVLQMSLSKIFYVLVYSVVFFPFLRKILGIYYANKLVIPQFIIDYLATNYFLAGLMLVCLLLFFWLAVRLMHSLPLLYQGDTSVREAVKSSLQKTKTAGIWKSYGRLLWLVLQTIVSFIVMGIGLYVLQLLADQLPELPAFFIAIGHVIVLHLAYYGLISLFLLKFVAMISESELSLSHQIRPRHGLRLGILCLASVYFGVQAYISIYFPFQTLPVTISHRGVDQENGVQNTIDALEKTAQLKPDYVEMDVQETKDGQFVVMHDTDLGALTGHQGGTHDYSLEELTRMRVSENGQSSSVASFDDYLQAAERLKQKLIVEIKTTKKDSPQMVKVFLKRYGQRLLTGGHQMQSLDYAVIQEIKGLNNQIKTAFILPFNSIYPTTTADGYTMEYTSLDQSFVIKSWLRQKYVYAWTPNDKTSMLQMIQLQVDGIITDRLQDLQETIREFSDQRSYADLIFLQFQLLLGQF